MPNLLELLYQALGTRLGIVIRVSDFAQARAKLYAARRAAGDPELECLQLRASPVDPHELWIVKGGQVAPTTSEETPDV